MCLPSESGFRCWTMHLVRDAGPAQMFGFSVLKTLWAGFQPWFQPWFGFVHFLVCFSPIAGERSLDKHICHVGWNHCLETNDRTHADWDYFIPRRDCLVAWFKFSLVTARWSGRDNTPPWHSLARCNLTWINITAWNLIATFVFADHP